MKEMDDELIEQDYLMKLVEAMAYCTSQIDHIYDAQMNMKNYEKSTGMHITKEMKVEIKAAMKACQEANHHLYTVVDSLSDETENHLAKYSKENVPHKYNRVRLAGMFVKQENDKAYLIELPLQVTQGDRERYLWISKKFCTRNKDTICIRYYDDFKFQKNEYDKNTGKQISSSQINVKQFEKLMIDANLYAARLDGKVLIDYPEMVKEQTTTYKAKGYTNNNDFDISL